MSFRIKFTTLIILVFTAFSIAAQNTQKPNIILIYADDLRRGLLGVYGQEIIKTPNIDRLANQCFNL